MGYHRFAPLSWTTALGIVIGQKTNPIDIINIRHRSMSCRLTRLLQIFLHEFPYPPFPLWSPHSLIEININLTMASRRASIALLSRSGRTSVFIIPRQTTQSQHLTSSIRNLTANRCLSSSCVRYDQQQANIKVKRDKLPDLVRGESKVFKDADEAVKDLQSGAMVLSAGFGLCGTAGKQLSRISDFDAVKLTDFRNYHCRYRASWKRFITFIACRFE